MIVCLLLLSWCGHAWQKEEEAKVELPVLLLGGLVLASAYPAAAAAAAKPGAPLWLHYMMFVPKEVEAGVGPQGAWQQVPLPDDELDTATAAEQIA